MLKTGHKIRNTGRTHWKKGHIPWNKGTKGIVLKPNTGWSITCVICGEEKYYQLNEHKKRFRKYCSLDCYHLDSRKTNLAYSSIHSRIITDWGKADECEYCGDTNNVDWANKDGQYLLDRNNWYKLCRKHHIAYDKHKLIIKD